MMVTVRSPFDAAGVTSNKTWKSAASGPVSAKPEGGVSEGALNVKDSRSISDGPFSGTELEKLDGKVVFELGGGFEGVGLADPPPPPPPQAAKQRLNKPYINTLRPDTHSS